jgi:replicative DNA helicase
LAQGKNKNGDHHIETERKIIHLMLKSKLVIDELVDEGYGVEFFDPNHQPIIEAIYQAFIDSSQRRLLTRDAYRQYLVDRKEKIDLMLSLSVFDKCLVGVYAKPDDLGVLKKQLVEAFMARKSHLAFEQYNTDIKKLGYVRAAQNLVDGFGQALGMMETRRTVFSSLDALKDEWVERLKQFKENPEQAIRCDIPEIDNAVNIGFRPQHLTLFVADVGGHKTNMMLNVALSLAESGHGVLFIPLEMDRLDLINRVVANRADIDGSLLARPEKMSDEQVAAVEEADLWIRNQKFYILDADERTSVSSLKREIEKRVMAFKPAVVIIDYVDNLQSDVHYGQKHIEIGEILKALRFLGKKHGFHIISAAQMGRAAIKALREGKEDAVDSTAIHGSHQYSADSDTIFAMMKVKNEPDKIKVLVLKARHGPSGHTCELRVEPTKYRITSTHATKTLVTPTDVDMILGQSEEPQQATPSPELEFSGDLDDDLSELG